MTSRETRTEDELRSALLAIGQEGPTARTFLKLMAAARGVPVPRGQELVSLAAEYGISRSAAYRAFPVRSGPS